MKLLEKFISSGEKRTVLCIVVETRGSCPGRVGFKMLVPPEGACPGSVGGGSMEFMIVTMAREMLATDERKPHLVPFDHTDNAKLDKRSGMICSGSQKIVLIPSCHSKQKLEGKSGLKVNNTGLSLLDTLPDNPGFCGSEDSWEYTEELTPILTVYIFGGGHCSLALTPVLNSLDLRVIIIDDRDHVWTMAENRSAWKKIVRDYHEVGDIVPDNSNALVVIMTASHKGDSIILRQMLPKNLKYLGMMASRATSKHILGEMLELGFSEKNISTVHTPIGIPISSQTPAEIAVSIAAEIVMVLNRFTEK